MGKDGQRPAPQVSPKQPLPSLAQWAPALADALIKPLQTVGGIVGSTLGSIASAATPPPTPLSALAQAGTIAKPADAPLTISIDAALHKEFSALRAAHVQERAHERGGTLVWHPGPKAGVDGIEGLFLRNEGRSPDKKESFNPDLVIGGVQTLKGTFHTHYYEDVLARDVSNPSGSAAIAPGGGDIAYAINNKTDLNVVYTGGSRDFLLVRTNATPPSVDHDKLKDEFERKRVDRTNPGNFIRPDEPVVLQLTKEYAAQYGFALYEGKDGNFKRVEP